MFGIGDTIEFELAPDGANSRYSVRGKQDRGATDKWRKGRVTAIEYSQFTWDPDKYTVDADGDTYHFYIGLGLTAAYPLTAIRRVSKLKTGTVRLVDKGDHYETEVMK